MICSWMNDGGFWVVGKLGGMTEAQTLKTWTVMTTAISIGGLGTALLLSNVLPFKQG
jgi:GntP family gluconate:H+ symporter